MGFELGEIDLNELVVLGALVGLEAEEGILGSAGAREVLEKRSIPAGLLPPRRLQVPARGLGEGENGRGRADLGWIGMLAAGTTASGRERGICYDNSPPMLQAVAMPVRLSVSTPGPKYSTM